MQLKCLPQSQPGDILLWSINPYILTLSMMACFLLLCTTSNHIRYYVNRTFHGTGWISPLIFICWIYTLCEFSLTTWVICSTTISTNFGNSSEVVTTNLPWIFWILQLIITFIINSIGFVLSYKSFQIRRDRLREKQSSPEAISIGKSTEQNIPLQEEKDRLLQNAIDNEQQRRREYNQKHLKSLEWFDILYFGLGSILHWVGISLLIYMQFYSISQVSGWIVRSTQIQVLFGYWFVIFILFGATGFLWMRYDPETYTMRRYIFPLVYCLIWFGMVWTSFLSQDIIYQNLPGNIQPFFISDGSNALSVSMVILSLMIITIAVHTRFGLRDNDVSHQATIKRLMRHIDECHQAITTLHIAGQTGYRSLYQTISTETYTRLWWYNYFEYAFAPLFRHDGDRDDELIQQLIIKCIEWGPTSDLFRCVLPDNLEITPRVDEPPLLWDTEKIITTASDPVAVQLYTQYARHRHDEETITALRDFILYTKEVNNPRFR